MVLFVLRNRTKNESLLYKNTFRICVYSTVEYTFPVSSSFLTTHMRTCMVHPSSPVLNKRDTHIAILRTVMVATADTRLNLDDKC
jgi:hypothetical protein